MARIWLANMFSFYPRKMMEFENGRLVYLSRDGEYEAEIHQIDSEEMLVATYYGRTWYIVGCDDEEYLEALLKRAEKLREIFLRNGPIRTRLIRRCPGEKFKMWVKRKDGISMRYCRPPFDPQRGKLDYRIRMSGAKAKGEGLKL